MGSRRPDGYHPLRSLMVALDGPADAVTVRRAPSREVRCPGLDGPANLAWRALDALERSVGRRLPVAVDIEKRIPAQAGLGGGSSDAAAVLVGADRLLGLGLGPDRLEAVAAEVGSDVPFFVRGGAQWAEGRGELLRQAPAPPVAVLLHLPARLGLSTARVYAAFDRLPSPPPDDGAPVPPTFRDLVAWSRNDLWGAALALAPRLGAGARALRAAGAPGVLLCGSGACLAGLFPDRAAAAAAAEALPPGGFRAVAEPAPGRFGETRAAGAGGPGREAVETPR